MTLTLHGTAVLMAAAGVLIRGESGSGKSRIALALIGRGARLVADDRVHISLCHGRLVAGPPAPTAGLIEARGRGILAAPFERWAVLRLVVDLCDAGKVERLPDAEALSAELCGVTLPRQPLAIGDPAAILLVERAALAAAGRRDGFSLHSP